ncbi:regulatory protein AfsR [Flexivirga endophytica]|uniref:Regulatory protein AfsR n=1 Tax=Flexivirga endophytica TaxID=1849103 RepID=A0A916TF48_9MICO|nr:AfsR/SARP family transcriptional regulator [Flexivirga endophytica]GGB42981.1 regulatory protein AfsR [Flexivirga endophytica]GHB64482.1 regulatory protein AfsR [Flexivirga endophytica]
MWFGVLGPLQVHDDGGSPVEIPPTKPARLLAILLAADRHEMSVDRIIEVLWAGRPPQSARSNVQVYVHRLRRLLGDGRLAHSDGRYRLLVQPHEIDSSRFEAMLTAEEAREGIALWRGEAYDGMTDLEVVREEADRLAELRLGALEARIDDDLRQGLHARLVPELQQLTARHPLRERFVEQQMLALHRSGRVTEALDAYRGLRSQLVEEVGVEPRRPVQDLHQRILNEDPNLAPPAAAATSRTRPVPAELPPADSSFTGRTGDLDAIGKNLAGARGRAVPIVAVAGPGGVGKSALALQAAHSVSADFPDGQLYLNLRGATPGERPLGVWEALDRLLRSLGDADFETPRDIAEASARLRTLTADRRLLVVLDDAVDEAQVRSLLPGGTRSAALITSRSVLTALDGASSFQLGALSGPDSVDLLERVAGAGRLRAEPAEAEELARLCDFLPLALRIAGGKLVRRPHWPVAELVRRMSDEQRRLDELEVPDRAVRTSFEVSYSDIPAKPARAFRLLGLLPGVDAGVPVTAALAGCTEREAEATLDQLVDAQLAESRTPGRYRLHDLLRLFAREQAEQQDPEEARDGAVRRALEWYLGTGLSAELHQSPESWRWRFAPSGLENTGHRLTGDAQIGEWLSREITNLVAAARRAATLPGDGPRLAAAFAAVLFAPMNTRGRWYELQELIVAGLEALGDDDASDHRALLENDLGWINALLGSPAQAVPHLERALAHWRKVGQRRGEATTLRVFARALSGTGQGLESIECARSALAIFRELEVREGQLDCLIAIGLQAAALGDLEAAIAAHEEGIAMAEGYGDLWHAGVLVGNVADLHRRSGDLTRAVTQFERALRMDRDSGNARTYFEAEHLWGLGRARHEQGDGRTARGCWDRSAKILYELGLIGSEEYDSLLAEPVPATPDVIARQL